jgi:hypothetical protein
MNTTKIEPSFLELAKQGNAKAITALMNRQLQSKGITAKAALKDGCLQVMLESAQVPNQQAVVAFIRKGVTSLEAALIERVKVYGRQTGEEFPAWHQEFEIGAQSNPFSEFSMYPSQEGQQVSSSFVASQATPSSYTSGNKPSYNAGIKQQPWYEQEINIFLLVLFFWPVGIYLMWKYSKTSTSAKWIITFICSLFFIAAISKP